MGKKMEPADRLPFRHYIERYPKGNVPPSREFREALAAARRERLVEVQLGRKYLGQMDAGQLASNLKMAGVEQERLWAGLHHVAQACEGRTFHEKDPIMQVDAAALAGASAARVFAVLVGCRELVHGAAGLGSRLGIGFCVGRVEGEEAEPQMVAPRQLLADWATVEEQVRRPLWAIAEKAQPGTQAHFGVLQNAWDTLDLAENLGELLAASPRANAFPGVEAAKAVHGVEDVLHLPTLFAGLLDVDQTGQA